MKKGIIIAVLFVAGLANAQTADVAAGKTKFQTLCASCHGPAGKGDGPATAALNPKPRNFSDVAYMKTRTDADLKNVIVNGGAAAGKSASMPPWKASLKDQDVVNMIAYIRTLGK